MCEEYPIESLCYITKHGDSYDVDGYETVHHWWDLSCGHEALTRNGEEKPNHCTECGKKVIPPEELMAKLRDAINERGHIVAIKDIVITEQVSRVKWLADRTEIASIDYQAYCTKCGLGRRNSYPSRIEAMEALFGASKGIECNEHVNFEGSDLEWLKEEKATMPESHFEFDEVLQMSDERLPIALGLAKAVQANIEREMEKRHLEAECK